MDARRSGEVQSTASMPKMGALEDFGIGRARVRVEEAESEFPRSEQNPPLLGFETKRNISPTRAERKMMKTKPAQRKWTKKETEKSKKVEQEKTITVIWNNDVVFEILSRLPARSVGRFRCVSKSWLSMATHSTFLRAHTQHRRAAGQSLVIGHQELGERLYLASAIAQTGITLCNLRTPFGSSIRASCDGLLCLWGDETRQYNIFNPLTGRSIILPNDKRLQTSLLGLYFRHSTSEYCLLAASQDETNILVVGSNSWKKISCRLPAFCDLPNTVDLNGCLHWLAWKQKPPIYHEIYTPPPDIIMTFDKESEIYDLLCLPLPDIVLERNGSKYNLVNFNGEFGLWVAYEDGLELWVLEESLVKKYSVKYGEDEAFLFFDLGAGTWLLGVAVSIGDEELLIDFSVHETLHYLIRWNLKSGAYTLLDWKINYRRVVTTFPYIESLLDPNHSF